MHIQQMQDLFSILYRENENVELRLIAAETKPKSRIYAATDLSGIAAFLSSNYNCYFGVNPRDSREPRRLVSRVAALYVDIDSKDIDGDFDRHIGETLKKLEALNLYPSAAVSSGNGVHLYWILGDNPPILETNDGKIMQTCPAWKKITLRLISLCNADSNCQDLPRILRLPGTANIKQVPHKNCELLWTNENVFSLSQFEILPVAASEIEIVNVEKDVFAFQNETGTDDAELQEITLAVLRQTPGCCDLYQDWLQVAMALKSAGISYAEADAVFRLSANYDEKKNKALYRKLQPAKITFGTAVHIAQRRNPELFRQLTSEAGKRKQRSLSSETTEIVETQTEVKTRQCEEADYLRFFAEKNLVPRRNMLDDDIYFSATCRLDDLYFASLKVQVRTWAKANFLKPNLEFFEDVLKDVSRKNPWHPIREWLDKLPAWDGNDRISFLGSCFPNSPIASRAFEAWLSGAVRRIYESGKQSFMLVLTSKNQGTGKSTLVKWLCPAKDLFFSGTLDPGSKDCRLRLISTWIWEVCELGATTRKSDIEALKAVVTQETLRERKSYGHFDIIKPCSTSFIGTVNDLGAGFLQDKTGNRRFLVVDAEKIDFRYMEIDLRQLWAQAKVAFEAGKADLTAEERKIQEIINEEHLSRQPIEDDLEKLFEIGEADDFMPSTEIFDLLLDLGHAKSPQNAALVKAHLGKKGLGQLRGRKGRGYQVRKRMACTP